MSLSLTDTAALLHSTHMRRHNALVFSNMNTHTHTHTSKISEVRIEEEG